MCQAELVFGLQISEYSRTGSGFTGWARAMDRQTDLGTTDILCRNEMRIGETADWERGSARLESGG